MGFGGWLRSDTPDACCRDRTGIATTSAGHGEPSTRLASVDESGGVAIPVTAKIGDFHGLTPQVRVFSLDTWKLIVCRPEKQTRPHHTDDGAHRTFLQSCVLSRRWPVPAPRRGAETYILSG